MCFKIFGCGFQQAHLANYRSVPGHIGTAGDNENLGHRRILKSGSNGGICFLEKQKIQILINICSNKNGPDYDHLD